MADDTDEPSRRTELFDGGGHDVERVGIECAEALVEEDGLESSSPPCRQPGDAIRERKRERKRCEKGLAAGERSSRPQLAGIAVVDDDEAAALPVDPQRILPTRQCAQYLSGTVGQRGECLVEDPLLEVASVEVEGEPAGNIAPALDRRELGAELTDGGRLLGEPQVVGRRLTQRLSSRANGITPAGHNDAFGTATIDELRDSTCATFGDGRRHLGELRRAGSARLCLGRSPRDKDTPLLDQRGFSAHARWRP